MVQSVVFVACWALRCWCCVQCLLTFGLLTRASAWFSKVRLWARGLLASSLARVLRLRGDPKPYLSAGHRPSQVVSHPMLKVRQKGQPRRHRFASQPPGDRPTPHLAGDRIFDLRSGARSSFSRRGSTLIDPVPLL